MPTIAVVEKGTVRNFTLLLEDLHEAVQQQPLEYVVSFTMPTSYWYLRHFDIKRNTDAVEFVNTMSESTLSPARLCFFLE